MYISPQGSVLRTQYQWNFTDGTPLVSGTGYEQWRTQVHSFARPGDYTVHVRAWNDAGASEVTQTVHVLGRCLQLYYQCLACNLLPPPAF